MAMSEVEAVKTMDNYPIAFGGIFKKQPSTTVIITDICTDITDITDICTVTTDIIAVIMDITTVTKMSLKDIG